MRRSIVMLSAALLVSSAALAADLQSGKTQISVFTSNLGWAVEHNETTRTGGIGVALSHAFTRNWAAEIKVAQEEHFAPVAFYTGEPPSPIIEHVSFHDYPVDLFAHYRFPSSSHWTPYVSAGFRYVAEPVYGQTRNPNFSNRYDMQVGVGTDLQITRHFGLRFDANRLVRSKDVPYDPLFRPSLGLTWRF